MKVLIHPGSLNPNKFEAAISKLDTKRCGFYGHPGDNSLDGVDYLVFDSSIYSKFRFRIFKSSVPNRSDVFDYTMRFEACNSKTGAIDYASFGTARVSVENSVLDDCMEILCKYLTKRISSVDKTRPKLAVNLSKIADEFMASRPDLKGIGKSKV